MPRRKTGQNVFEAALERLVEVYSAGHRIVVSFSAGKDSGVCLELCVLAARACGRLPVDVVMRDEEIMFPGTFEYAERVWARPEVAGRWIYACQPIINVYNRELPYWWVFDPLLPPEAWVRTPPAYAERVMELNIERMNTPDRFPPAEGKELFSVVGLRVSESRARMYGLFSSKGHITKPNHLGVRLIRPIYDWSDGDIWKAIADNHWDYNEAYDVMNRLGMPRSRLRIAPPTMNVAGTESLRIASRAWPQWFERVAARCPGVRSAANFGARAVSPQRRLDETWEQAFHRLCIDEAPEWIRKRGVMAEDLVVGRHNHHASTPLPDIDPCYHCVLNLGSWKKLTEALYNGDPFSVKTGGFLPLVEPEEFREGAGFWMGKPAW